MKEKLKRNTQIFLSKYGYMNDDEAKAKKPTGTAMSFRQLSAKYNLSVTYLQEIVSRMEKRLKTNK